MKSFTSSAANVRLKLYLKNLNLWDGEMSWLGLDKEKNKTACRVEIRFYVSVAGSIQI
jgi:hypothetical protein